MHWENLSFSILNVKDMGVNRKYTSWNLPPVFFTDQKRRSAQSHIQDHHDAEPGGKEDRREIGVLSLRHFGDQFFHNHVEHRARGEAQKNGERRNDQLRGKNRQHRADRLDNAGENTPEEGSPLPLPLGAKRHGNNRTLRKVLNRDADGQGQRTCRRDLRVFCEKARIPELR